MLKINLLTSYSLFQEQVGGEVVLKYLDCTPYNVCTMYIACFSRRKSRDDHMKEIGSYLKRV